MRKSARILFTLAALAVAVSPVAGKDDEVNFKYDKLLKKSFDELGDGSIVPVTVETATEIDGTMSADGQYMFYSSDRERGNFDIYLRSMTDITTVRVTSHPSKDVSPAVSRDGRRLAFVSFREDPLGDIYVMDTDPASMIESASDPDAESFDSKAANISMIRDARGTVQAFRDADPAWSPDGKNVVFSSTRNGSENLFICDREGKNLRQLTTKGGTTPRYSEDGSAIVFVSYRDNASGEIYVLNPASGKETRVTDEPGVKLYPSFGKTTAEISYTLIDADTNKDGKIDFKDRSVLMYMNTARKISYQLTLGSVSSFRGRFFPSFPLSYTTKEVNYQGVILYSEQSGNNININIIPEYGVIPKRKTEELQYSLAEDYAANQEATDRVILSYLRVYQFNPVSNNPSPVAVRALFRAAIGYRETGDMKSAAAVASKLRSLSKNEDDYCGVKARILDETLAGKDPGALYQKGVSLVTDAKNASFMKEDAADYRLSKGDSVKAGSLYRSIVESDEKFRNIAAVKYQLGLIESGKGTSIPSTLVDVFKIGRQTQKDKASLAIVSILAREKNARKRIGVIEDFRTRLSGTTDEKDKTVQAIQPVLAYAEGVAFVEAGDSVKGAEWFQKAIASLRTTELMYYEANLRMAEISAKKGDTAGEEKHLSLIANNYLPRWNRSDFGSVINRLIAYYENTGANLESTGKYDKAAELYTRYINMLTYLHLKKKFEDVYNEYAPRAHVLYIDSFAQSKSDMFDALSILEKQYLGRLPIARLDFDKAFIYGLGYIYAKRGAEQERQLDEGALTVTEGAFTESYLSAQNHLAWAFFMDDTFVDPYLLQGWMNQAIDLRRVKLQNQNAAYKLWKLNKSFPPYLWERNKSVYEKGIEAADASKFPDKSGSLHLNLGNTYFLLSNYPLALEHYEAAARLKKGFGSRKEESLFRYHLSYCYWQTGKTAEAKREMLRVYDAYSQLASTSTGRQYAEQLTNIDEYMAMYERTLGNYNESIKWHERAIADGGDRLRSDLSRITLEIAWCAMKAGDYPRAYRICSKAEEMLSREPSDDQEFILRLYLFHVIGINFYDLGPDKVVIGDSRIFSHLSVTQKKLFLSSIREELGMRKGDYAAVSAAVNEKIAILKGRTTDADKDALIRAYNGIGNSLFRLGRYSEARNYFEKGWQFATDPEVNNLRGAFISVKNSVSLYGFILENSPELIADPAGELALLDKRINGFQTGYEDARYAEMKAAIDEEAEARDKPVDPAKLAQAKAAAAEEAKQVCADLDASRAVIDFYRAEFVPADGNTDPMKAFRDAMTAREMYLRAGAVFESSLQAVEITVPRRIKLYMNAALCREKTGYARKAYELLGKAEKLASDSKRDDLLWEMYYREALFLLNSGKEVEENSAKLADNYFRKAMAVVENIPSLYADSPRVTRMYRDYRDTLIARGDYKEALSAYAKALSMERIASASRMMALSSDAAMKDDVSSYLSLTVKLRDAKRALSDFIDSGSTDAASRKTIEANIDSVRKEIADKASDIRTRDASAYSLVVSGRDDLSSVSGKVIIMISRYGDDAVIWKIGSGEGPAARVRLSDTDKIMSLMSGNVSQDAKRYVIMDDDAFAVMDGIPSRGLPFTWAPSINWIRTSGDSRKESPSTVATYGRDVSASKMPDIMICPDTDSVESLTAGNGVSPVIIVFPQSGVSKMRWLAESALMNGARSAVFIPATKIAAESGVFRTAAGRVSSIQNGSDMRIAGYDDEMVRGADTRAVSVYYEHEMIAALSRGDATGALTASLRYDAVTASSGATASKSALARAKAAEMTDSPSAVDYARNAAASGSADAVSYLIYSLLNRGNVSDADVALKSA
ncbi:MAG TPA: tetratricopeptide repeat protein, partial [Spirochaetota bacterium]|nr:tetratricopeptide repeat protein [Spirochaetota bacterium]